MVHVHGRRRVGATMSPEGKDNLKGQACWGCKRNSLLPLTLVTIFFERSSETVYCRNGHARTEVLATAVAPLSPTQGHGRWHTPLRGA
jgi:hypothetical protein